MNKIKQTHSYTHKHTQTHTNTHTHTHQLVAPGFLKPERS